jgi:hypothetical protein
MSTHQSHPEGGLALSSQTIVRLHRAQRDDIGARVPTKNPIGQHQKLSVLHAHHVSEQSFERQASCHKKLKFAVQTRRRLVLHSHASVRKSASIRRLCACKGDAGRRLLESRSHDRAREARRVG